MPDSPDGLDGVELRREATQLSDVPSDHRPGAVRTTPVPPGPIRTAPPPPGVARRRGYVPLRAKFVIALMFAIAWLLFSIWVSQPWMEDLGNATHPVFAILCLTFIAYAPGFMNAFLILSLLMDRRPPRFQPAAYPPLSILVAAYQEERTIIHTLASIARERYPGKIEILILNDGSTDGTAEAAARAEKHLHFPANATVRIINYAQNRGKAAVL